jgi:hypothetical protein
VHDGDAGLTFAAEDGGADRAGAAVFRQQRRVDVDAAEARQRQHRGRQQPPVGGDDDDVGREGAQLLERLRAAQVLRLEHRQAVRLRQHLDGRRQQLHAALRRSVHARPHAGDLIALLQQRPQRSGGELRRAHEYDLHRRHSSSGAPFISSSVR